MLQYDTPTTNTSDRSMESGVRQWEVGKGCREREREREHNAAYTAHKATIHQVTTMLATSKNVPFPDYNHLLTTGLMTQHFDYRPSASEIK